MGKVEEELKGSNLHGILYPTGGSRVEGTHGKESRDDLGENTTIQPVVEGCPKEYLRGGVGGRSTLGAQSG